MHKIYNTGRWKTSNQSVVDKMMRKEKQDKGIAYYLIVLSLTLRLSCALYSVFRHWHDLYDTFDIQICKTQNKNIFFNCSYYTNTGVKSFLLSKWFTKRTNSYTHAHTNTTPCLSLSLVSVLFICFCSIYTCKKYSYIFMLYQILLWINVTENG
jgi:hypothetical protein